MAPATFCVKRVSIPKSVPETFLYTPEGRYLQEYARSCSTKVDLDLEQQIVRVSGAFERVQFVVAALRTSIQSVTSDKSKSKVKERQKYQFYLSLKNGSFQFALYEVNLTGFMKTPFVLVHTHLKPRYHDTVVGQRAIGKKLDTSDRLDASVRAMSMLLFSEGFQKKEARMRFQIGKLLFFREANRSLFPAESNENMKVWGPSVISTAMLRQLDEGVGKDFRSMFLNMVPMEISKFLTQRLLDMGFVQVATKNRFKLRFYDRVEKTYLLAKYELIPSSDGRDSLNLIEIDQAFPKQDTLVLLSAVLEVPDVKLYIKTHDNQPSTAMVYAYPFANSISFNSTKNTIKIDSPTPTSRFEINLHQKILKKTYVNTAMGLKVSILDVCEDDGRFHRSMNGSNLRLNDGTTSGDGQMLYGGVMELVKQLLSITLP